MKSLARFGFVGGAVLSAAGCASAVQATSEGLVSMGAWLLPVAGLAVAVLGAVAYHRGRRRHPLAVSPVSYHRGERRLEVAFKNLDARPLFLRPALLLQQSIAGSRQAAGGRLEYRLEEPPMLAGRCEEVRRNFSLVAWEDEPTRVAPYEVVSKTFVLDSVDFRVDDAVSVDVAYGRYPRELGSRLMVERSIVCGEAGVFPPATLAGRRLFRDLAEAYAVDADVDWVSASVRACAAASVEELVSRFVR